MGAKSQIKSYVRNFLSDGAIQSIRRIKQRLGLVESGPFFSHIAAATLPAIFEPWHRRRTFQDAYRNNRWGAASGEEFFSGLGSRGEAVDIYVSHISDLLSEYQRKLGRDLIVVDLGCGDFTVGRRLLERNARIKYIGCDVVPELIAHHREKYIYLNANFRQIDIVSDQLPIGDVVLVRQVLQHLSNNNVEKVLGKLRMYKRVFITEGQPIYRQGPKNPNKPIGSGMRFDWRTGRGRGLEFDKQPFNLKVQEICRAQSTDVELVVTHQVFC